MKPRVLLSLACGCEATAALYAIIRTGQYLLFPEPNPALVMQSVHAGFFWRAWTAAYCGGFVALLAFWIIRNETTLGRMASRGLPVAAALAIAQGIFAP